MSQWYEKSFGRTYLDLYPHRDATEAMEDIRGLTELTPLDKKAPLLDLCCGAGRHLVSLHKLGFKNLTGLDLSGELLQVAAEDLAEAGAAHVELIHGDMRKIPATDTYATILSLFTSFGYFDDDEDNRAVIRTVRNALAPGGIFILDYFNAGRIAANLVPEDMVERADRTIHNVRQLSDDGTRVEKTITVKLKNGITQTFHESVRLYLATELRKMIERQGLKVLGTYGSTKGEPYAGDSERTVVVCRKPA